MTMTRDETIAAAQDRFNVADDALRSLMGARSIAKRQHDERWLAEIDEQLPAVADEQRAASRALWKAVTGEPDRRFPEAA